MPINYPTVSQQQTSNNIANYVSYAQGQFTQDTNIVETDQYTASYDAVLWAFSVSSSVPTSTTMSIAMPTSSAVDFPGGNNLAPRSYTPSIQFIRFDTRDVKVQLSSSHPRVVFGFAGATTFTLSTASYTNMLQVDAGFDMGGNLIYLPLEQSALP